MRKALFFCMALLCSIGALAQTTVNCTVSCNIVSDPFPPSPSPQPTSCTLRDGANVLNVASVAGPAGAVYCSFTQTFAAGRTVSLTATATFPSGSSNPSAPPLVFTSNAPPPPPPPTGTFVIGESTVLPTDDCCNNGLLLAQNATLSQGATIASMSFYVVAAGGQLRLGIYDASGPSGGPGAKKAETAAFTPVVGWNTAPVTALVQLPAGTYWLAYTPSSGALAFKKGTTAGVSGRLYTFNFGPLPAVFSTSPSTTTSHWSMYATFNAPLPAPQNLRVQ